MPDDHELIEGKDDWYECSILEEFLILLAVFFEELEVLKVPAEIKDEACVVLLEKACLFFVGSLVESIIAGD